MSTVIIIMGVSGCGKTSTAKYLSEKLGYTFIEGDEYHSATNIELMKNGMALTDENRQEWLLTLNYLLVEAMKKQENIVLTCSALKQKYRDLLVTNIPTDDSNIRAQGLSSKYQVLFVHLEGSYELIYQRLCHRNINSQNHFFPQTLLQSQFDTLEPPNIKSVVTTTGATIRYIRISVTESLESIYDIIRTELRYPERSDLGIFGMGTMGSSLARNFSRFSYKLSLYNRYVKDHEENVAIHLIESYDNEFQNHAKGYQNLELFVASLLPPRIIILLIDAGNVIDIVLNQLLPLLDSDDIIVDMGNSYYIDTLRRVKSLDGSGIHFCGCGISGGEYGALHGPSIMVSGDKIACDRLIPYFHAISCPDKITGCPCCTYVGTHGSGHYVKMIHNGIEYAEMQLLTDVYTCFLSYGITSQEISTILKSWNDDYPELRGYLLDITIIILQTEDTDDNNMTDSHDNIIIIDKNKTTTNQIKKGLLIEKILDNAKSKGTGNWATLEMTKESFPATMIATSLFARFISSFQQLRMSLSSILSLNNQKISQSIINQDQITDIRNAYMLSRILNHIQGFWFLYEISNRYHWSLQLDELARIWTNGCIIRSTLMQEVFVQILKELQSNSAHVIESTVSEDISFPYSLMTHTMLLPKLLSLKPYLTKVVSTMILSNQVIPTMNEALNFLNSISTSNSTSNLIQAQRDYFGAHTFQRIDKPKNQSFHHRWPDISLS